SGRLIVFSSNPAIGTATISGGSIANLPGGLISTILPRDLTLFLANAASSLNLHLLSANNITNSGIISSSGSLTLVAGGSIVNSPAQNVVSAAMPVITATTGLNLNAPSIVNRGSLVAQQANVSIITPRLTNSGVIQAPAGSVNIANASGNYLSVDNTVG